MRNYGKEEAMRQAIAEAKLKNPNLKVFVCRLSDPKPPRPPSIGQIDSPFRDAWESRMLGKNQEGWKCLIVPEWGPKPD